MTTKIPEKLESRPYGHSSIMPGVDAHDYNAIIDVLHELTSRIDTIEGNQLEMKRGEKPEPYLPQMCWCGEVDCLGAEVEVGGKVHRPDHPCYELTASEQPQDQPKRWPQKGDLIYCFNSRGDILEQRWNDSVKQNGKLNFLGIFPTREAAEAYKAKLLSDNAQV